MIHRLFTIITIAFICIQSVWAGTKRALIIGLSQYPKYRQAQLDWQNIHGANDAVLISNTLRKQGFRIHLLTDQSGYCAVCTKSAMQA